MIGEYEKAYLAAGILFQWPGCLPGLADWLILRQRSPVIFEPGRRGLHWLHRHRRRLHRRHWLVHLGQGL